MPAGKLLTVIVVPLPVLVTAPGLRVSVHVPGDGRPLSAILPVAVPQVGCVMVPITGAVGVAGCIGIAALPEAAEVQPLDCRVTVKVKVVLPARPLNVAVVVLPVIVAPPGVAVTVQLLAGRLLRATLPVATVQVGAVIVPTVGADGVTGCAGITALPDGTEVQPLDCSVTVKV